MIREKINALNLSWSRIRSLPPRQQLIYIGGAAVVLLILYLSLWLPLQRDLARLRNSVPQAKVELAQMQVQAKELDQLRASGRLPGSSANLLATLEQTAVTSGLRQRIMRMEPDGTHSARLTFEGVNFNAMIGWLANLQSQGGIRVERATIEPLVTPGTVNAKITLRKAGA